jgi:hypothetical protein
VCPFVDDVCGNIAEQQVTVFTIPERPFDKPKPAGQLLDFRIDGDDVIELRVEPNDFTPGLPKKATCPDSLRLGPSFRRFPNSIPLRSCLLLAHPDLSFS